MRMTEVALNGEAMMSNVGDTAEFRIRSSAKAFSILSDALYSNKTRAIVRELSTNALDSHIEADNNQPFVIHLPTEMEPWFSVKDQGVGLDHDGVMNLYTTYFESTKTDSDDFVGALGLGSKSPFSYTDNFTVIATQGGHKGIYTAFINDQGFPSIVEMSRTATDQPAGVEVRFGVHHKDFHTFHKDAEQILKYFDPGQWQVCGVDNFSVKYPEYVAKNFIPGFHVIPGSSYHHKALLVMGNIAYPVNMETLMPMLNAPAKTILESYSFQLDAPIGAVDIQPSREALGYTAKTVAFIQRVLTEVHNHIQDEICEKLDTLSNNWELAQTCRKINQRDTSRKVHVEVINDIMTQRQRRGILGHWADNKEFKSDLRRNWVFRVTKQDLAKYNIDLSVFEVISPAMSRSTKSRIVKATNGFYGDCHQPGWDFNLSEDINFVVSNTGEAVKRAKHHFHKTQQFGMVIVMKKLDKKLPMRYARALKELFFSPESVWYSSELDRLENKVSSSTACSGNGISLMSRNNRRYTCVWKPWSACRSQDGFQEWFSDHNQLNYYVPLKNNKAVDCGFLTGMDADRINELCEVFVELGTLSVKPNVFGVRPSMIKQVQDMPNWIPLDTKLCDLVQTQYQYADVVFSDHWEQYAALIAHVPGPENSRYEQLLGKYRGINTPKNNSKYALNRMKRIINEHYNQPSDTVQLQFQADIQELESTYPMLKYLYHSRNTVGPEKQNHILEYVNLVDNA